MDSSEAGPNSAQQHPPSPGPVPTWENSLNTEPDGGVLDGLALERDTKKALLSFITTGQASKEEVKQLYEKLCLSGLIVKGNIALCTSLPDTAMPNKAKSPLLSQNSNEATLPALPPTPATTEDSSPAAQELSPPMDLKDLFIHFHLSGKIGTSVLQKLYNLSPLADIQQFASLIETSEHATEGPGASASDMDCYGIPGSEQLALLAKQDMDFPLSPNYRPLDKRGSGEDPNGLYNSRFAMLRARQEQTREPSYIVPTVLDQTFPGSFFGQNQPASPTHLKLSPNDASMPAYFASVPNGGLPSPVATRASSQSDGPTTPNAPASIAPASAICTLLNKDDSKPCGKRCDGPHRWRSMQEHIRRAHPERYLPNLSAEESSIQAMVQFQGVICTIEDDGGVACGERFEGNKKWRLIQDHVRDKHPAHWVSNLPANETSYKLLMNDCEYVDCPLPKSEEDPSICGKHTFGDKRWRSMMEHIRRAHQKFFIPNLTATEESIVRMCEGAGVTLAPSKRLKKRKRSTSSSETPRQVDGPPQKARRVPRATESTSASTAAPISASTATPAVQRQTVTVPLPDDAQQAFASPTYFPQQNQASPMQATLAPSALESSIFSPSMLTAFHESQFHQLFENAMHHPGLGINLPQSVATLTAQNLDQTLSPELFSGQAIAGQHQHQAMQTVYGDAYTTGPGQFAQSAQNFLSLQGIQPLSPLQPTSPMLSLSPMLPISPNSPDFGPQYMNGQGGQ